jgi:DNA-binding response OmpR family regulator
MALIMIVDDDTNLAVVTSQVLWKNGHQVAIHSDPEAAFNCFKIRRPDLVILDVMFPENTSGGFDLARRIARESKSTPILMLTAVNSCFQFGFSAKDIDQEWLPAVDFLEKPLDFEVLVSTVDRILGGKAVKSADESRK